MLEVHANFSFGLQMNVARNHFGGAIGSSCQNAVGDPFGDLIMSIIPPKYPCILSQIFLIS